MDAALPLIVGRYALYDRIASGGMATVYIGRLAGPVGFAKTVAIKRLHPQFASDADFVAMFLDEARLAARIQHPNVVSTLDVVTTRGELFLVMEYVRGESVSALLRLMNSRGERMPERIVAAIASGTLQGLHAAHAAKDEAGRPLGIVHRDVSPQNVLVGVDGTPRVLDFGVAKAQNRLHSTRGGEIKGKLVYMSPEQLEGDSVDSTADVYAMGLLLFEMLTGRRMFQKSEDVAAVAKILRNEIVLPSSVDARLAHWDPIVHRATLKEPSLRFPTARAMALEVERVVGIASSVDVGDFVEGVAGTTLSERSKRIAEIESVSSSPGGGPKELEDELARPSAPAPPPPSPPDPPRVGEIKSDGSAASRVSHALSLSETVERPHRWWFTATAIGVVTLGLAALLLLGRQSSVTLSAGSLPSAPSPPASTAAGPATPTPPAESATAAPPPTGSAALAAAVNSAPPAPRPSPPPSQPKATAKPKCDRPYTVDSAGHMHFRAECL